MVTLSGLARQFRRLSGARNASKVAVPGATAAMTAHTAATVEPEPGPELLRRFDSWLPSAKTRQIVILADERADPAPYLDLAPAHCVQVLAPEALPEWTLERRGVVYHPARTTAEINWVLRSLRPLDLIVALRSGSAAEHDEWWQRSFLYLRPKGLYLLDRNAVTDRRVPDAIAAAAARVGLTADQLQGTSAPERELAQSVAAAASTVEGVALQKRNRHLLKVRDADAGRILAAREPKLDVTVLDFRLAGTLQARNTTVSHGAEIDDLDLPATMDYPRLTLRHYRGRIAMVSNALLHTQNSILPDSFRHHLNPRLVNPRIEQVSADLARVSPRYKPQRTMTGNFYHVDLENSGHFGHLMTEGLGRLWGWDEAKRQIPDLKLIFRIRYRGERVTDLERRIFAAYGIDERDVVTLNEPVWLESVVAATPMFHNAKPHYIHPEIERVWTRLRTGLVTGQQGLGERVFVSRRANIGNRACRNARDVESFFVARGFAVVYPEEHDVAEQAAIFAAARVVAGFAGSAMFNLVYARQPTVLVLGHEAYTARNEHLIAAVVGGVTHYFWSTPDIAHPEGGWSEAAYYSDWEFDFARNGEAVDHALAES